MQIISHLIFYKLNLVFGIPVKLSVKFTCCVFQLVQLLFFFALCHDLLNSALNICTLQLLNFQNKLKKFQKLLLLIHYQIFIPDKVDRVSIFSYVVLQSNLYTLSILFCARTHKPIPPEWIFFAIVK
jgi:hypothetical protein